MTNDAPKRIWAAECRATNSTMWWPDDAGGVGEEYIRADHAQSELQAALAAEREACAKITELTVAAFVKAGAIRARTDTDAQSALEAVKREARNEALRECLEIVDGRDRAEELAFAALAREKK